MASKIYGLQTINRGVIPSLFHTIKFHHVAADWANLLTCADGAAICPRGKSTSLLFRKVLISAHKIRDSDELIQNVRNPNSDPQNQLENESQRNHHGKSNSLAQAMGTNSRFSIPHYMTLLYPKRQKHPSSANTTLY